LAGKSFGDCVCGFPKADHTTATGAPKKDAAPAAKKTAAAPPAGFGAAPSKGGAAATVEYASDKATLAVYNNMVASYKAQHNGKDATEEQKLDWASNLVLLTVGKTTTGPGCAKLKIRAAAVPKKQ
jgi:hypothetical protein